MNNTRSKEGIVPIHGREYKTVALRVSEFREEHPDWTISTDIVSRDADVVVMKATIMTPPSEGRVMGYIVGTGYAEEHRASSQINKTSALENCETSAIGRALAACGYGGTEYASANEVQNAIHQQSRPTAAESGVENIERKPSLNPDIDAAEMVIRGAMNKLNEGKIERDEAQMLKSDAIFALGGDEKEELWGRFNAPQRRVLKAAGMDW